MARVADLAAKLLTLLSVRELQVKGDFSYPEVAAPGRQQVSLFVLFCCCQWEFCGVWMCESLDGAMESKCSKFIIVLGLSHVFSV